MKFGKQFSAYMIEAQESLNRPPGLSCVGFKRLKKLLKHCPLHDPTQNQHHHSCPPSSCAVCDPTFFPLLMEDVEAVLGCFNSRVETLLQMHLASGFHKYMIRLKYGHAKNHQAMIHEAQKLIGYLHMNALAIRKIIKKYDKDMVFDPVSLRCGHIFCNSCACSAASVPTVPGLKSTDQSAKCALCRQTRVYKEIVYLTELGTLIKARCKDYWEKRLQRERVERLEQVKKHWDQQCRAVLGI